MLRITSQDLPEHVISRDGTATGEVIGNRPCQLAGCTGHALIVRWPDHRRTHPCLKGLKATASPKTLQLA